MLAIKPEGEERNSRNTGNTHNKTFLQVVSSPKPQIQEAPRTNRINAKQQQQQKAPGHTIFELQKFKIKKKKKIAISQKEKNTLPMEEQRITSYCFSEVMQKTRIEWNISSAEKTAPPNLEFHTLWNYPPKVKEK